MAKTLLFLLLALSVSVTPASGQIKRDGRCAPDELVATGLMLLTLETYPTHQSDSPASYELVISCEAGRLMVKTAGALLHPVTLAGRSGASGLTYLVSDSTGSTQTLPLTWVFGRGSNHPEVKGEIICLGMDWPIPIQGYGKLFFVAEEYREALLPSW